MRNLTSYDLFGNGFIWKWGYIIKEEIESCISPADNLSLNKNKNYSIKY